jgi:DNA-directed RNA polymerase specialized sigma24 family protein
LKEFDIEKINRLISDDRRERQDAESEIWKFIDYKAEKFLSDLGSSIDEIDPHLFIKIYDKICNELWKGKKLNEYYLTKIVENTLINDYRKRVRKYGVKPVFTLFNDEIQYEEIEKILFYHDSEDIKDARTEPKWIK